MAVVEVNPFAKWLDLSGNIGCFVLTLAISYMLAKSVWLTVSGVGAFAPVNLDLQAKNDSVQNLSRSVNLNIDANIISGLHI